MKFRNFHIRKNPCWHMGPRGWFGIFKYFSGKLTQYCFGPLMLEVDRRGEGAEWVANTFGICPKHGDRMASGIAAGCKTCRALRPDKIKEVEKNRDAFIKEVLSPPANRAKADRGM